MIERAGPKKSRTVASDHHCDRMLLRRDIGTHDSRRGRLVAATARLTAAA